VGADKIKDKSHKCYEVNNTRDAKCNNSLKVSLLIVKETIYAAMIISNIYQKKTTTSKAPPRDCRINCN
jgi:hypothetical protein